MIKEFNQKVLNWMDKIFVGRYTKYTLFITALLDSIIAILPTDLIVSYYFLKNKKSSIFLQSIFIATASVIGGSVLYFFGDYILNLFLFNLNSEYYLKIKAILVYSDVFQFLFITFFAFSSLIPFTWLSILLGIFNLNYSLIYIPAIFIGRFLRFYFIAYLSKKYGMDILIKINRGLLWFFKLFKNFK